MTKPVDIFRSGLKRRPWLIKGFDIAFLAVGLSSLVYAVVTAPRNGIDFANYYAGAQEWLEGIYEVEGGALATYPPFAIPIFSPLASLSLEKARVVWLGINLLAAGASVFIVLSCYKEWPARAKYYLILFAASWAPFRVTLRVGQISLVITALLLGALLARRRNRKYLAGVLLGISMCKFTLSFPFFVYFVWKKEWRMLIAAVSLPVILSWVYALRLGVSVVEVWTSYAGVLSRLSVSTYTAYVGATEIKPLLMWLARGDDVLGNTLLAGFVIAAVIGMGLAFARRPDAEPMHFAILALFALWAVYHRTYDSVLYILPVALLVDLLIHKRRVTFAILGLAATGLLIVSLRGLFTSRLGFSEATLSQSIPGFAVAHIERVLTFGLFVGFWLVLWREGPRGSRTGANGSE